MKFSSVSLSFDTGGFAVGIPMVPLVFPVDINTHSSPYILKSVDGLGPPDINVSFLSSEKSVRNPQPREIVMQIGFKPNYSIGDTIEDLRNRLYSWLTPKFSLPIKFGIHDSNGTLLVFTTGHIKRFESSIFSKDPEVQIVFTCSGPYLTTSSYVYPNPGTLPKNPIPIINPGNAPTGFSMQLTFTSSTTSVGFNLWDKFIDRFWVADNMHVGDILTFNTDPGSRLVQRTRSGVVASLMHELSPNSKWLMLHDGLNLLEPSITGFTINNITLYPKYWGV